MAGLAVVVEPADARRAIAEWASAGAARYGAAPAGSASADVSLEP